jgi:CheY-like chemotaxis protein
MRVLIIEDDEFKQRRIEQVVKDFDPSADLHSARSVNSGLQAILATSPELILLDMSLTTFDVGPNELGGRPQNFGGMEVLRQMDRLDVVTPVVVITQHEKFASAGREVHLAALRKELVDEHEKVFSGLVYYNSAAGRWEKQLRSIMMRVRKSFGGGVVDKNSSRRR